MPLFVSKILLFISKKLERQQKTGASTKNLNANKNVLFFCVKVSINALFW